MSTTNSERLSDLFEGLRKFARSFAIAPGGNRFVLGADWYLRLLDGTGKPLWRKEVASPGGRLDSKHPSGPPACCSGVG